MLHNNRYPDAKIAREIYGSSVKPPFRGDAGKTNLHDGLIEVRKSFEDQPLRKKKLRSRSPHYRKLRRKIEKRQRSKFQSMQKDYAVEDVTNNIRSSGISYEKPSFNLMQSSRQQSTTSGGNYQTSRDQYTSDNENIKNIAQQYFSDNENSESLRKEIRRKYHLDLTKTADSS